MDFGEILNGLALSLNPEIFVIGNLILAIPVFAIFYTLAKRKVAKENRMKFTIWRTIFITPLAFLSLSFLFFSFLLYYPQRSFDAVQWEQKPEVRYKMTKDLIKSEKLMGMTKQEVLDLLGDLDRSRNDTTRNHIYYSIGYLPRVMNLRPDDILEVEFEDGLVSHVFQTRVRDREAAWAAERNK